MRRQDRRAVKNTRHPSPGPGLGWMKLPSPGGYYVRAVKRAVTPEEVQRWTENTELALDEAEARWATSDEGETE